MTSIDLTDDELRTIIAALYDKRMESERYRNSSQTPTEPGPQDLCCDEHHNRWKRNRDIYVSMVERVKFERDLIKKLEAKETT